MYTISKPRGPWQTGTMTRWGAKARSIVIQVEPQCLALKPKGTRTWFRIPWGVTLDRAVLAQVLAERKEKSARRKQVRRGMMGGGR